MSLTDILLSLMFLSTGILAGFLSGLLGVGGGVIIVPILMFVGSLSLLPTLSSMHVVVATSLFAVMFTSSNSFYNHKKAGNVDIKAALFLTSGTIIAAILTPRLMIGVDSEVLKKFIGGVVGVVGLFMFFEDKMKFSRMLHFPRWSLFPIGLILGTIAMASGLGGGIFYTPILIYLYSLNIKKAIGTSTMAVATAMFLSTVVFMFFSGHVEGKFQVGYVNMMAGIPMAIGGFIGPRYGVKLLNTISVPLVRKIFSIFLILDCLKIFGM
jgi:uncharacterized membrane protein YfcA